MEIHNYISTGFSILELLKFVFYKPIFITTLASWQKKQQNKSL